MYVSIPRNNRLILVTNINIKPQIKRQQGSSKCKKLSTKYLQTSLHTSDIITQWIVSLFIAFILKAHTGVGIRQSRAGKISW